MRVRPLHDRVIVQREANDAKSAGGIVLAGAAAKKPDIGKVVAFGNGRILDDGTSRPLDVKFGDRVLFEKLAGTEVRIEGEDYVVLREKEIMAVFDGE